MMVLLFSAIIILVFSYYMVKKRFEVVYTVFLSGMIAVLLKYMISNTLRFTEAPPSIEVMMLATLAVFNWRFWLLTLFFFIEGLSSPLSIVAGLLLGYGFGKWHFMKKHKVIEQKNELRRKVFHCAFGFFAVIVAMLFPRNIVLVLCMLWAFSPLVLLLMKNNRFGQIALETKRSYEWLGKGTFYYGLGAFLPLYIGQPWILLILALSDGISTLIGRLFGYTPLFKSKTMEGTFAGFLVAWAIARHFYPHPIIPALLYLLGELWAPIDDNFAIPVFISLLYFF